MSIYRTYQKVHVTNFDTIRDEISRLNQIHVMSSENIIERKCILLKYDGNPISLQERDCIETTYPEKDKNVSRPN